MSATPKEIGTLIVVALKANHLPNKRQIGKQSPYCEVVVNGEKRRTRAIKKGGQHPEWDEELRFTLYEDTDDILARSAGGDAPPPPPKEGKAKKQVKVKGGKKMKLACYAEDSRDPELIGECDVDLTEVLTKGETDEWFTLKNKEKFAGKVYLELTFWSNEPAPEKKPSAKPLKNNKIYGGPGDFVPQGETSAPSSLNSHNGRVVSAGAPYNHSRAPSDSMSHLRPSSSMAQVDYLYQPPYEQQGRTSAMDRMTNDFGQFGLVDPARRESFPPQQSISSASSYSSSSISSSYSYGDPNARPPVPGQLPPAGPPSSYTYGRAEAQSVSRPPSATPYHRHSMSGPRPSFLDQAQYQAPYQAAPTPVQGPPPALRAGRGPRSSIPASSSGFAPLPSSSTFSTLPTHPSEPSGFVSRTPAPALYNPSHYQPPAGYQSQTPMPQPGYAPPTPMPPSNSSSFNSSLPFPASQSYQYPPYAPPPTAPPQEYLPEPGSSPHSANHYPQYPDLRNSPSTPPPSGSTSISASGSRPLPQQPAQTPFPISHSNPQFSSFTPPRPISTMYSNGYHIPPPPAPPALHPSPGPGPDNHTHSPHPPHQEYASPQDQQQRQWSPHEEHRQQVRQQSLPPPPPPPSSQLRSTSPGRQSSLPPVNQNPNHPLPAPPAPPAHFYGSQNGNINVPPPPPLPMPPSSSFIDYGGVPPPPPLQSNEYDYDYGQPQQQQLAQGHGQQYPYFPGPPSQPPPMPFEQSYSQQQQAQQQWA